MDDETAGKELSEEEAEAERVRAKVESMLGKVGGATRAAVSPADGHDDLEEALDRLKQTAQAKRHDYRKKTDYAHSEASVGTAVGFAVAYNLVGCVLGGWLLGFGFDKVTNGTYWGQVGGIIFGAVAGIGGAVLLILRSGGKKRA
ncbi:MAG: hypothetical protein KF857_08820 [Fimbriimonadaceae bacterium]|nr:hypothetical protein [Fimbriimonadaceae bacterium]